MLRHSGISRIRYSTALVVLLACLSWTSCAYYNTFFFAKKHYKEAGRAREMRRDDQATALEIQHYEKCIQQCSKVLAEHPDSKYVDDALFLTASSYYHWGRTLEALKWYRELVEKFPESELMPEARLMIAECHLALREYVEAESILLELHDSPVIKEKERDQVLFALAEVYSSRGDEDATIRSLQRLISEYPKSKLRLEAMLAVGDAYFSKGVYDSAATSYETVARDSGKKDQRVEARKRMGQAYFAGGDPQGALDIYSALLLTVERPVTRKNRTKDPQEAALVLKMGECQNALGDHERALELFQRVMDDFQSSTWAAEAEFLTGYTYEIYFEDLDRAKTSYDRVPSHSQLSVFVSEAKRRGEGLGKLREYIERRDQAGEEAAGDIAAEGLYLSAELNLFDLNKPEYALELYRQVENDYPESQYAPKAAYAGAWVLVNKLNRPEEGYDEYRRILTDYPYSEYADGVRRILDMQPLAALFQGPPIPEGWTPPDTTETGEGGGPDTAAAGLVAGSVADTVGVHGIAAGDTSGIAGTVSTGPESAAGGRASSPGADSLGAPADTASHRVSAESETPRWPGTGGGPADTSGSGVADPPAGGGDPPGAGTGPADTSEVGGTAPADTTAAGQEGGEPTDSGSGSGSAPADSAGQESEVETAPAAGDSTGSGAEEESSGADPGVGGPPEGQEATPDTTGSGEDEGSSGEESDGSGEGAP